MIVSMSRILPMSRRGFPVLALSFAALLAAAAGCNTTPQRRDVSRPDVTPPETPPTLSTFSIVARDASSGELGIAVQSRFFGVGAVVPWLSLDAGAIATQSYANTSFGPRGLSLLREGKSASETLEALLEADDGRAHRQVGIVDRHGGSATATGDACLPWAGGRKGPGYAVQGNILVGEETVAAMERAFLDSEEEPLVERLLRALEAGQRAGGDIRGRQSAAIRVLKEGAGYGGNDRYIWYNVEDHPRPIRELRRLVDMRRGRDPLSQARAAARRGDIDDARSHIEQAAKQTPGDPFVHLFHARMEARQGNTEAMQRALETAIALQPDYDNLYYHAAALYSATGLEKEAVAALSKLLELNSAYGVRLRSELDSPASPFDAVADELRELLGE